MFAIARNAKVTVGTSSVEVLPILERIAFCIKNTGTTQITLAYGSNIAVVEEGLVLDPGDYVAESDSESFLCWAGGIQAVSDAVGGQLSVMER